MRPNSPIPFLMAALIGVGCAGSDTLSAQDELTLRAISGEEEDSATGSADFALAASDQGVTTERPALFRECDAQAQLDGIAAHFDENTDGKIEGEEEVAVTSETQDGRHARMRAHRWEHLAFIYDADDSGDLDDAERATLLDDFTARCDAIHERLLEEFDADGSGELDESEQEEVRAAMEARRAERDAEREASGEDGEGMCNGGGERGERGERPGAGGDGERPARDIDGLRAEGPPPRLVEEFDVDGDGSLSVEETETLRETVRARIRSGEPRM